MDDQPTEQTEYTTDTYPATTETPRASLGKLFITLLLTLVGLAFIGVCGLYITYSYLSAAPANFPTDQHITITPGTSVRDITVQLAEENVVGSGSALYYTLVLFHEPTDIKASTYVFTQPLTMQEVAERLTEGDFDTDLLRLTLIEGERAAAFGRRAEEIIPNFSAAVFTEAAEEYEGYLFPDTYFIPAAYTETELLTLLRDTFTEQTRDITDYITTHSLSEREILILASIVEREANDETSMKMVAGILQNRLEIGMALQTDASIEYVLDTPLGELPPGQLAKELKELDSPYNTYLYPGLPPTPIGNPGLTAINAVLEPTPSDYLFYITGNDGEFYYAETLREHNLNIARYLR